MTSPRPSKEEVGGGKEKPEPAPEEPGPDPGPPLTPDTIKYSKSLDTRGEGAPGKQAREGSERRVISPKPGIELMLHFKPGLRGRDQRLIVLKSLETKLDDAGFHQVTILADEMTTKRSQVEVKIVVVGRPGREVAVRKLLRVVSGLHGGEATSLTIFGEKGSLEKTLSPARVLKGPYPRKRAKGSGVLGTRKTF